MLERETGRADDLAHSVRILGDPFAMLDCGDDITPATSGVTRRPGSGPRIVGSPRTVTSGPPPAG